MGVGRYGSPPVTGKEFEPERPLASFWDVSVGVLLAPSAFFSQMPRVAGYLRPSLYAVACGVLAALIGGSLQLFESADFRDLVTSVIAAPFVVAVFTLLSAALTHPCVVLYEGLGNAGFEATFRIFCYTSAPLPLVWLGLGGLVAVVFQLYLLALGIRGVHASTRETTAFAVLAPLLPAIVATAVLLNVLYAVGFEPVTNNAEAVFRAYRT